MLGLELLIPAWGGVGVLGVGGAGGAGMGSAEESQGWEDRQCDCHCPFFQSDPKCTMQEGTSPLLPVLLWLWKGDRDGICPREAASCDGAQGDTDYGLEGISGASAQLLLFPASYLIPLSCPVFLGLGGQLQVFPCKVCKALGCSIPFIKPALCDVYEPGR